MREREGNPRPLPTEAGGTEPGEAGSPPPDPLARDRAGPRWRGAVAVPVVALVLAGAVVVGVLAACGSDEGQDDDRAGERRSATTSSRPETTTGPTAPDPEAGGTDSPPPAPTPPTTPVLWPGPGHPGFTDPVAAARSFTQEAIGFTEPALSAFRGGPAPDRGQVDVHSQNEDGSPRAHVASTLSLLRHEGRWYVTEARAADVVVASPAPASPVGSPLTVQGQGQGFEGTIFVEVRAAFAPDGQVLAQATTQAGALSQNEPYSATLSFDPPSGSGAVVVTNDTGVYRGTVSFTAFPVAFG
jgi:hypothetical protein